MKPNVLENIIETMLNNLCDAGYVTVKFMHMGADICWRPTVHRQTQLTEFDPGFVDGPAKEPPLPTEIYIEISPQCFLDLHTADETMSEIVSYIERLNRQMEA